LNDLDALIGELHTPESAEANHRECIKEIEEEGGAGGDRFR
jgi:hypothetical protein